MSAYGMNLNASIVRDVDGKYTCGIKMDDSAGLNVSSESTGDTLSDILEDVTKSLVADAMKQRAALEDEPDIDDDDSVSIDEYQNLIDENDALVERIDELEAEIAKFKENKPCPCAEKKTPVADTSGWKAVHKKNDGISLDKLFGASTYDDLVDMLLKL